MTRCSTISRIPNPTQIPDTRCGPGKKTRYVIVKLERPTTNKQRKKEEEEIDISVYRMPSTNWLTKETSAPIGAWEVNLEIMTDRQTDRQPTNRPSDRQTDTRKHREKERERERKCEI